jgi:hypothetical protein
MRLIIEYIALGLAGWLSFNVLFVVAWARFHAARRRFEDQSKGPFIVFRRNDDGARSEVAYYDQLTGDPFKLSLKKTS